MTKRRPTTRLAHSALALSIALPLLGGCAILEGPTPTTPEREAPAAPEVAPELVPGGTAADNLPYFTEVIRAFAEGDQPVQGQPVAQAVIDAGFDRATMQVSFDQSKTGLPADNIFVSVQIGSECLIGQVVAEDRTFVAENEPAIGPEGLTCLIGETRPLDW